MSLASNLRVNSPRAADRTRNACNHHSESNVSMASALVTYYSITE
jgi:hypothetical protein